MKTQRLLIPALIVSVMLLLLMAVKSTQEKFDKISVREFELADADGKERAFNQSGIYRGSRIPVEGCQRNDTGETWRQRDRIGICTAG